MARVIPSSALEGRGVGTEQDGLVVTVMTPHRSSRPKWTPISSIFGDFPSRPSSKRSRNQVHPDAVPDVRPVTQLGERRSLSWAHHVERDVPGAHQSGPFENDQQIRAERSTAWLDAARPHTTNEGSRRKIQADPADHAAQWSVERIEEKPADGLTEKEKAGRRAPYSSEAAAAQVESLEEEPQEREAAGAGSTGEPAIAVQRSLLLVPVHNPGKKLFQPKRAGTDWRRNRDELDRRMAVCRVRAAVCGLGGTLLAIAQNELILRDEDPQSLRMNVLKGGNSVLSLACVWAVVVLYRLDARLRRLRAHLYSLRPLDTRLSLRDSVCDSGLWIEGLLCAAHVPPFVTFEVASMSMENFVLYRAETVGALVNTLRLYLVWRVFRDRVLSKLPKRHTVAAFHGMEIGSAFAFKMMLTGNQAVPFIASLWASTMLLLSYWFRAAEITACALATSRHASCALPHAANWTLNSLDFFPKHNDLYVQNAAWAMFVTSTTVGYGEMVPTTHFGRTVAAVMALGGIVLSSLLTASLANSLHWTPAQMTALLVLEREKARHALKLQAAERLTHWWRARQRRRAGQPAEEWDLHKWKLRWNTTRRATQVEVEDCLADNVKIDRIARASKALTTAMDLLETRILALFGPPAPSDPLLDEIPDVFPVGLSSAPPPPPPPPRCAQRCPARKPAEPWALDSLPSARLSPLPSLTPPRPPPPPPPTATTAPPSSRGGQYEVKGVYRDRTQLDRRRRGSRTVAATCGLLGAACAVAQNELLIRGESPSAGVMEGLKAINSALTLACLASILYCYHLSAALHRLEAHIHRGAELHVPLSWAQVLGKRRLWAEILVCGVHLPPYITFEIGTTNLTNFMLYRGETVLCAVNLLRVYLPWRVIRDCMLADLPRRYTVAAFANVELGSSFAIKRMLNSWFSLLYLAALWALLVVLGGYLFRSAEITACQIAASATDARCQQAEASSWSLPHIPIHPSIHAGSEGGREECEGRGDVKRGEGKEVGRT